LGSRFADRINQLELADLKSMLLALQQFLEDHPSFAPIPADLKVDDSRRKGAFTNAEPRP
jgi:hypothetical protein